MMELSEATRLYQAALEELRGNPEDAELEAEVARARAQMETLWLQELFG